MPLMGSSSVVIWTTGEWTSQLLDVSLKPVTAQWNFLKWEEVNTGDTTKAYVKVDILDSSLAVLQADLVGVISENDRQLTLSDYANVIGVDIYIRFKLFSKTEAPIVSNIEVS